MRKQMDEKMSLKRRNQITKMETEGKKNLSFAGA
jgi:hypothetical protein